MDWFYHAPGEGRIGPLSADELRKRYGERRIQRDTLVWREGLQEWQPLERVADEVDLYSVTPDTTRPPPLPAAAPIAMAPAMAGGYGPAGARGARPEPRRTNGCLIALVVAVVASVPLVAILAAIALPAYQDYTLRTQVNAYLQPRAAVLRMGLEQARAGLGRCPQDASEAGLEGDVADGVRLGQLDDGRCAFEITLVGVHPEVDGRTILHVAPPAGGGEWDCTGGDLPANYRTAACRAANPE